MKKIILIATLLLSLNVVTALSAEPLFKPGEWDLSPFATYNDKVGDDWGFGASLRYFVTDKIGVGAATYWTDFGGTFFDNVAGEAYFRIPVFETLAPYAVGSVGYQFDSEEWFETIGGGVDFRATKNIGIFGDVSWRFANETQDGVLVRLGVRLSF